jgi:hypothetical protein
MNQRGCRHSDACFSPDLASAQRKNSCKSFDPYIITLCFPGHPCLTPRSVPGPRFAHCRSARHIVARQQTHIALCRRCRCRSGQPGPGSACSRRIRFRLAQPGVLCCRSADDWSCALRCCTRAATTPCTATVVEREFRRGHSVGRTAARGGVRPRSRRGATRLSTPTRAPPLVCASQRAGAAGPRRGSSGGAGGASARVVAEAACRGGWVCGTKPRRCAARWIRNITACYWICV